MLYKTILILLNKFVKLKKYIVKILFIKVIAYTISTQNINIKFTKEGVMKVKISLITCTVLSLLAINVNATETTKLEGVEVNSVGDNISESGISEGFLNKNVQQGMLAEKKVINLPYQINTISKEIMNNQGVTGYEEAVKYFPSAQIQMRGGATVGRP